MSDASTHQDIRWRQRFQNFKRALRRLSDAVALAQVRPLSELEQQGLIQAFEFTHELAWNTLKDFLESRGETQLYGSKDTSRRAYSRGLIADGEVWMAMIQSRNQSSHTYDETTIREIAQAIIERYLPAFRAFCERFEPLESESA